MKTNFTYNFPHRMFSSTVSILFNRVIPKQSLEELWPLTGKETFEGYSEKKARSEQLK